MSVEFEPLVAGVGDRLWQRREALVTAESCTGGWVAKVCTDRPGSSGWFERGFVTYSNEAKQELLGVSAATLENRGAVSEATVREMVAGALRHSHAHWGLAISGIAGPGGATPDKPVGTVWFAWAGPHDWLSTRRFRFDGDRDAVRRQAVETALEVLLERLRVAP
ncbi:MAG TPA: CinA family protein [Gammaproteobacteria bacterium]|nr:CinA family protein [Gammaproteobacteria bacterium]